MLRQRFAYIALLAGLIAAACGGEGVEKLGGEANLFRNPGFEEGSEGCSTRVATEHAPGEPWFSIDSEGWGPPCKVSSDRFHSGQQSALLNLRSKRSPRPTQVYGLAQEVAPPEFPEVVSGYYRVENWQRGAERQYLQFVVIVSGADNMPGNFPNHQLRFILAGIDKPPFQLGNAHFVFIDTGEPKTDEWVFFERNVREDFEEFWGAVPEGYDDIRILFEVRYDEKDSPTPEAIADVYYDDLYVGPADGNTNQS